MYNEIFEQFSQFNKNLAKPFAELQSLTIQTTEKITRNQLATTNELLSLGIKHLQDLNEVKKAEDFVNLQNNLVHECTQKYMQNANEIFNLGAQVTQDFNKILFDMFRK